MGDWKLIRNFVINPDQRDQLELLSLNKNISESSDKRSWFPEKEEELNWVIDEFVGKTNGSVPPLNL